MKYSGKMVGVNKYNAESKMKILQNPLQIFNFLK